MCRPWVRGRCDLGVPICFPSSSPASPLSSLASFDINYRDNGDSYFLECRGTKQKAEGARSKRLFFKILIWAQSE